MALELHVWGPAFSLPSIDAHCLAAIAYLQQAVPRGKWQLIASSNPALSPTNELPALRNGDIWIGGFRNIFHYIAQYSGGEWVLDAELGEQEGADCIAFSSFVEAHGQPLLDLSLYVSTQNYTAVTRPIYNTIQSFPLPYLTPPFIRAGAKERTEHLGLSSLDVDSEDGDSQQGKSFIPESLRRTRATVSSLLASTPETAAQIRLDALATSFFEPLQALRGKKQFFVSDTQFSSLDCLALGYLSLMLLPDLPQPWLARTMRNKFPQLCSFVEELQGSIFGAVRLDDVFGTEVKNVKAEKQGQAARAKECLPWKAPNNGGVISVGGVFLSSLADSIPIVGQLRRNTRLRQSAGKTIDDDLHSTSWQRLTMVGSIVASLGLFIGVMFQQGLISLPSDESIEDGKRTNRSLGDFGEAGAALAAYASQMDSQVQMERVLEQRDRLREPVVEVDVDTGSSEGVRDRIF